MALSRKQNPQAAESLAYTHPKIEAQLDAGVRQLELDVFGDTKGGLLADPLYLRLVASRCAAVRLGEGYDAAGLQRPACE
jgi:hypothetical protein